MRRRPTTMIVALVLALLVCGSRPASATYTVTIASCGASGGANTCTTGAINTASPAADVIVCGVAYYEANTTAVNGDLTDNQSNGYTVSQPTPFQGSGDGTLKMAVYRKLTPTTNASHTFTFTGPQGVAGTSVSLICMAASQGSAPTLDGSVVSSNTTSGTGPTTIQAGSLGAANDIVATFVVYYANNGQAIDSSFATPTEVSYSGGNHIGIAGSWKEVSGAVNPTWSVSGNNSTTEIAMSIAFTGVGGSLSSGPCQRMMRGFGKC